MSKAQETAELAVKLAVEAQKRVATSLAVDWPAPRIASDAVRLKRLAASLRGLAERECSDPTADCSEQEGTEFLYRLRAVGEEALRRARLEAATVYALLPYGLRCDFNRDPRGCAVYIHFPDGAYNTLGGKETGWGI